MSSMDDPTGINDAGKGSEEAVDDSAARAACERVSRRMAGQRERQNERAEAQAEMDAIAEAACVTATAPRSPLPGWSGRRALVVVFVGIWIIGLYTKWFQETASQTVADAAAVGLALAALLKWNERRRALHPGPTEEESLGWLRQYVAGGTDPELFGRFVDGFYRVSVKVETKGRRGLDDAQLRYIAAWNAEVSRRYPAYPEPPPVPRRVQPLAWAGLLGLAGVASWFAGLAIAHRRKPNPFHHDVDLNRTKR